MTFRGVAAASGLAVFLLGSGGRPAAAQTSDFLATDATMGRAVLGAPYSADGMTTVTQTLGDGTRIQRAAPSKFHRDSDGNLRREQTVLGLAALDPAGEGEVVITITHYTGVTYTLNPATRVARRTPGAMARVRMRATMNGDGFTTQGFRIPLQDADLVLTRVPPSPGPTVVGAPPPPPPPPPARPFDPAGPPPPAPPERPELTGQVTRIYKPETHGTKQIEGLVADGRRTRQIIPTGAVGNDRPIEITSERWESRALLVTLMSHHHDPRTGTVEFRLTNISRTAPPRELFVVPADYTIVDAPPPPPAPPRR